MGKKAEYMGVICFAFPLSLSAFVVYMDHDCCDVGLDVYVF